MPITLLTIGPVHDLVQGQTYALPARTVRFLTEPDPDAVGMQVSNDGLNWAVFLNVAAGNFLAGNFIRFNAEAGSIRLSAV